MRVVSGIARGRPLKSVPGMGTRPTTDKVKEAIFSMIGPYFSGGVVLDLFAGTGALGIEALSRGMDTGFFVDQEYKSIETIRANLRATGLADRAEVYRNDAFRAIKTMAKRGLRFDLVFLDPPYKIKTMDALLLTMQELSMIRSGCVIVIEHDARHHYPEVIGGLSLAKRGKYGDTAVSIYQFWSGDQ
ncbi:MAG TPA: 16S rRNA (guanine(966)-N(2))-methyltransferase RsmD [Bacilli bacterium]